jgi:hypothetical protein
MQPRIRRLVLVLGLALVTALVATVTSASADVTATRSAKKVARAIAQKPKAVRTARWVKLPPRGQPAAISTSKLVGFPRAGKSYGVLSTGDATMLDDVNEVEDLSHDNGGPVFRGGAMDAVVLRVDLRVPRRARCLSFSFRYLSEEYDEFIDTEFNDGFLAEMRRSTWRTSATDPRVNAPRNIAFDRQRTPITVNSTGDFSVTPERAASTTYDGGTRRLRASRKLTKSDRRKRRARVFFSVFDQGDREYDSSVVIDRLQVNRRRPCRSGASLD